MATGRTAASVGLQDGEVELAIRPQALRVTPLSSEDDAAAGNLPALVRHKTFLGALTRLELVLDDGQSVIAVLDTGDPVASLLAPGGRASIECSQVSVYAAP
jgi:hypothetical protein